jgi:hypothetical protein
VTRFIARCVARIDADQLADDRIGDAVEVDAHGLLDRRLHVGHAGCGAQRLGQRIRRPLDAGEHVGEAALRIKTIARQGQRIDGRQRRDEATDAAGDDQRDGECLAPHQPQIAQQFAVEGFHLTVRPLAAQCGC